MDEIDMMVHGNNSLWFIDIGLQMTEILYFINIIKEIVLTSICNTNLQKKYFVTKVCLYLFTLFKIW